MANSKWLLGPLLWEVARYWQQFGDANGELFSLLYPNDSELAPFATAFESKEPNDVAKLIMAALALAQGKTPTANIHSGSTVDKSKSATTPALASVLSRVRLKQDDAIETVFHHLPELKRQDAFAHKFEKTPTLPKGELQAQLLAFMAEMKFLQKVNCHTKLDMVLSLVEKYFWCLPVMDAEKDSDIPLFAVAKLATAIVACWEKPTDGWPHVPEADKTAYTLIQGDLIGIQKYIYRIASAKGVAKGLKGRSFELSLLSDMVAKYLLRKFNLTSANVIYSSGGKFFLLAPEIADAEIESIQTMLAAQFYNYFDGDIFMGLAGVQLCGDDFNTEKFADKWDAANRACNAAKQRKFLTLMLNDYKAVFLPKGSGEPRDTCQACGREEADGEKLIKIPPKEEDEEERIICVRCFEMEKVGRFLSRAEYLVEVVNETKPVDREDIPRLQPLALEKDHSITYYIVPREQPPNFAGDLVTYYSFETLAFANDHPLLERLERPEVNCVFRFYGGNTMPLVNGKTAEYDHLAKESDGIKRLGVLRMDVDNLGLVFSAGLGEYEGEKLLRRIAPPARVMALSWRLNYFFTHLLNRLRQDEKFKDHVLIVYSGGDDLFVVGSWDRVVQFAIEIKKAFSEFACNRQLTISGGIAMVPRKFPIHKAASFAGDAEAAAKEQNPATKDAFTFLDKPLRWADFDIAASMCQELVAAIEPASNGTGEDTASLNKGIIDRLRRIYGLYDQNRRNKEKWRKDKKLTLQLSHYLELLRFDKWRWMLTYTLRRYSSNKKHDDLIKRLQDGLLQNKWKDQDGKQYPNVSDVIDFIDVPTRWAEFLTRDEPE